MSDLQPQRVAKPLLRPGPICYVDQKIDEEQIFSRFQHAEMVEVTYTLNSVLIAIRLPKQYVCGVSFRFRKLCQGRVSYSFTVKDLIGMTQTSFEAMVGHYYYSFHNYISCFAVWLDTSKPTADDRPYFHTLWLFGQLLQAPKFMNDVMRRIFDPEEECEILIQEFEDIDYNEGDHESGRDSSSSKQVGLKANRKDESELVMDEGEEMRDVAGALDSTIIIECWKHSTHCYGDGEEFHTLEWRNKKMLKYLVDWFAYSGMKGRGGYNRIAREAPKLAMQIMKAIGVREASKHGRPPWHKKNQGKYLVDENMGKDWFTN